MNFNKLPGKLFDFINLVLMIILNVFRVFEYLTNNSLSGALYCAPEAPQS